jgi:hypothetical protein
MTISTCAQKPFPHGIDITAPGGIDRLIEFHRGTFGDWQMNVNGGESGGASGSDGSGDGDGQGGDGSGDGADGDKGLKSALVAERKATKAATAELAAAQARVKELEDASKSDEQRAHEEQEQLKSSHAKLTREGEEKDSLIERYRVAAAKGLDLQAAERLKGATREEIEKDADDWIALWGTGGGRQEQHRGDPGQGPRGQAQESSFAQGSERAKARFGEQK